MLEISLVLETVVIEITVFILGTLRRKNARTSNGYRDMVDTRVYRG